eukprot:Phypoly_transcript_24025.p1 GENE.Phypoly_transcript_24025~~Phypoly_transcript_24025.p1  ORF type:complete len:114 (+),score=23.39 Phypoly_transcript_24025:93-434(+)
MSSTEDIRNKSDAVLRTADTLVSGGSSGAGANAEPFQNAVEELYNAVRSIPTSEEVSASADKLFRQSNLLKRSAQDLENAVRGGGSVEPYYTQVKNGTANVQKTAQQLNEEAN